MPNPPKRSQGPQKRASTPSGGGNRRGAIALVAAGAVALVGALLAIVLLTGGDGDGGERAALESAGCTLQSYPALANVPDHSDVPTLETKPDWNSSPPTSGPHYGQPGVWGLYDDEVPVAQTVHNLEHGGVVIHYGPDVPESEVTALRDWFGGLDDPNGLIISPLSTNKAKITLSAWTAPETVSSSGAGELGWLASCTEFDEGGFEAFINVHRYKGPERLTPEQLAPGT